MTPTITVIASSGSPSAAIATTQFMIPGKGTQAGRYFPGLFSEMIIFSRRISNSDIDAVKKYLIQKYNIKNEYNSNLNA